MSTVPARSLASVATAPSPSKVRCQYGELPGRWRIPRPESAHAEWATLSDRCQVSRALGPPHNGATRITSRSLSARRTQQMMKDTQLSEASFRPTLRTL